MDKQYQDNITSLEIRVNAVRSKLDYLLNADNGIDSKAGVLIAVEMAVVTFSLQNIHCVCGLCFVPITLFCLSICLLWQTLQTKGYNTGVVNFYDNPSYQLMSSEALLAQLLSDYQKAYDDNYKNIENKSRNYKWALNLFFAGLILLLIFLF